MFNMFARLLAWFRDDGNGARRACYGIVVSCVWMLLFCVLAATVSVWKAFAFASLSLAAFGVVDYLAPDSWCVGRRGGAGAERESTAAAVRRFGLAQPAIDALATLAYASRGAEGGGDLESGSDNLCSVCLEDIQAGEMVRQLPTCKHLFHVECIDMWLHSHRTCPLCRCDLSPPRKILAKVATVETELPAGDALPPVATVETEPPADDALPPV